MPLLKKLLLLGDSGNDPLIDATLTLASASATPYINTNNVFTATLLDVDSNPLEGYVINFSTSGLHSDAGTDTTDASGEATFTLTSTYAGADTVTAIVNLKPNLTDSEGVTWSIEFLLNSQFPGTVAPIIPSPYTATPTGTLTISDTSGLLSIADGVLNVAADAGTPTVYLYDAQRARVNGLAAMWSFNPLVASATLIGRWGWHTANNTNPLQLAYLATLVGNLRLTIASSNTAWNAIALANNTPVTIAIVQFTTRNEFYYLSASGWRLIWVDYSVTDANMYAGWGRVAGSIPAHTQDNYRVAILGAATTNLYAQLIGNITAGMTSAARNGNCLIAFDLDTLPSAGSIEVKFRIQDANNYWIASYTSGLLATLGEVVGGILQPLRGSAAVTTGKARIIADGTTIAMYDDNAQLFTYGSASNFQNATAIEVSSLGTGGAISDMDIYDRYAVSVADANLDALAAG